MLENLNEICEDKKQCINETAPEGPVQEQVNIKVSFNQEALNKKIERINALQYELMQEINSLPSTITFQNS